MASNRLKATWILYGIAAAALVFFFSHEATAGVVAVTITAGLMNPIKAPASGGVVLQLPGGAMWLSGQASTGLLSPRSLPVPAVASGPWSLQVTPNMTIAVQWQDAAGAQFTTILNFT